MTDTNNAPSMDNLSSVGANGLRVVRNSEVILGDIDVTFRQGEHWIIMGANGSGKSTLINVLARQIRPSAGNVWFCDQGRIVRDARVVRTKIAMLSNALLERLPQDALAYEIVLSGLYGALSHLWDTYSEADRLRAEEHLGAVGAHTLGHHRFGDLSQGERQRVALARAAMGEAPMMFLDEVMGGLDLGGREDLLGALDSLVSTARGPILTLQVTHHVEEIGPFATHVLLLSHGRMVAQGEIEGTLSSESLSEAFERSILLSSHDGRFYARAQRSERFSMVVNETQGGNVS